MKTVFENDFAKFEFDEGKKIFYTLVNENSVNVKGQEIMDVILVLAQEITQNEPLFIMTDDRKRGFIYDVDIQKWVAETVAHAAINAGVKKYAILLPTEMISSLSTEQTVDEIADLPLEIKYFEDEEKAMDWLMG